MQKNSIFLDVRDSPLACGACGMRCYLCVSVQKGGLASLTVKFRCSVAVPAVHDVVPSMVTVPLPLSDDPFPIGSAEEIPPASPLPAVAFMLLIPSVMVIRNFFYSAAGYQGEGCNQAEGEYVFE